MKRRILWLSLLVALAVVGAGCGQQANPKTGHKDSQSTKVADKTGNKQAIATKAETPKPSALTMLLSPLMGKNAEDPSTQSQNELTYSQFYYQHNNWYWRLSSKAQKTIVGGKITTLNGDSGEYKLTGKQTNGDEFTVKLMRYSSSDQSYWLKSSAPKFNRAYVIGDTNGSWTTGAPTALIGTWSTHIYKPAPSKYDDAETLKKEPYSRTRFFISDQGIDGQKDSFTPKYTVYDTGNGWGANDATTYKQLSDNTYLLRTTLSGRLFNVYKVTLKNKQLTVAGGESDLANLNKVSSKPGQAFGFDNSSALHLTSKQLDSWIDRHLSDFNRNPHQVKQASFMADTDKKGRVTVDVYDYGRDIPVAPRVGRFRVTAMGVLEGQEAGDTIWWPVSDDPTN